MNDLIEEHYIKYFECLNTNDRDICDNIYLNSPKTRPASVGLSCATIQAPLKPKNKGKEQGYKQAWVFVNRGNFVKK